MLPTIRPAANEGVAADIREAQDGLAAYLRVLLEQWNLELNPDGEFAWRILSPPSGAPILAVLLETRSKAEAESAFEIGNDEAWRLALRNIASDGKTPVGGARILVDTFYRLVSDTEILIIKRDERRFWTKSSAREDAEATILRSMLLQERST